MTDRHVQSDPPEWSASSLQRRPRSGRSPCGFQRRRDPPGETGAAVKTPRVRVRDGAAVASLSPSRSNTLTSQSPRPRTGRTASSPAMKGSDWFYSSGSRLQTLDHKRPPHLAGAGTPQVDAGSQAHAQQVARRPVHQVEVEVVLQLRGVQHFERDLRDLASWFPRRA